MANRSGQTAAVADRGIGRSRMRPVATAVGAVIIGLLLTAFAAVALRYQAMNQWRQDRIDLARVWIDRLETRLGEQRLATRSTAGFVANSEVVTREEFRRFTRPLLEHDTAITSMAWQPRVTPSQRPRFESRHGPILERGGAAPTRAEPREAWFPRLYIEPELADANISPTAPDDPRYRALNAAVGARQQSLSRAHPGGTDTPGAVTLIEPVLRGDDIAGLVTVAIRLTTLFAGLGGDEAIAVRISDVSLPDQVDTLYQSAGSLDVAPLYTDSIEIGERRWRIEIAPAAGTAPSMLAPLIALVLGIAATALVTLELLSQSRRAQIVEDQIAAGSEALREANANLRQHVNERETTLRALRESEGRYRLLADHANDIISRHTRDGTITYVSPAIRNILGYTPAETEGHNAYEFFHPDDREAIRARLKELLPQYQSFTASYRVRHREGHTLWIETVHRTLPDSSGAEILCISRDVSARMQAEQALRDSEEVFRAVFEHSAVGMAFIATGAGDFIRVNHELAGMLGYSIADLEELTVTDVTHPADQHLTPSEFQQLLAGTKEHFTLEKRYMHKNGSTVWIQAHTTLLRHLDGEPRYFVSQITDISERKHTEERLARLSHQQDMILNAAGEGIYGVDMDGIIVFANQAAGQILGYAPGDLVGASVAARMHHTDASGQPLAWEDSRMFHSIRDHQTHYVDGELFRHRETGAVRIQYVSSPIIEHGRATGAVVVFSELDHDVLALRTEAQPPAW